MSIMNQENLLELDKKDVIKALVDNLNKEIQQYSSHYTVLLIPKQITVRQVIDWTTDYFALSDGWELFSFPKYTKYKAFVALYCIREKQIPKATIGRTFQVNRAAVGNWDKRYSDILHVDKVLRQEYNTYVTHLNNL